MILAGMASGDPEALECDFAQYYHVLSWRELGPAKAARLAAGLPPESRSWQKLRGQTHLSVTETLLAMIADYAALLWWGRTEDGYKNRNRPESVLQKLRGQVEEKPCRSFSSGEEFEAARAAILARIQAEGE